MKINSERGFSLVEMLASCGIFAILGLGLANSILMMHQTRGKTYHNSLASQIAIESIENFQSYDPATLTSANSSSATVVRDGIRFLRRIIVSVNTDQSRSVNVQVTCPSCKLGGQATVSNNFPLWGSV